MCQYCNEWGLSINLSKTKVVIFSNENKYPTTDEKFYIGSSEIEIAECYTYLGIRLNRKGNFKDAVKELRKKAFRALFGLMRSVGIHVLSPKAVFTLFDALVKPVILYGCQIWGPHDNWVKHILFNNEDATCLSHIAKSNVENFHLKFLKWYLGTHSKTCNVVAWGETGRGPILLEIMKLSVDYFDRVSSMDDSRICKKAFLEQKSLNLPWFVAIQNLINRYGKGKSSRTSVNVHFNAKQSFINQWECDKGKHSKLSFYNSIKTVFEMEKYLNVNNVNDKKATVKLRGSSHRLNIEIGRYKSDPKTNKPPIARENRICNFCFVNDGIRVVEDERHVIESCAYYDIGRKAFSESLLTLQSAGIIDGFSGSNHTNYFKSSDDIRICRAQSKFSNYILTKHKDLEIDEKSNTKKLIKPKKVKNKRKKAVKRVQRISAR